MAEQSPTIGRACGHGKTDASVTENTMSASRVPTLFSEKPTMSEVASL